MVTTTATIGEGTSLTYVVTVQNGGPAAASGVVLHSFVPTGTLFVSLTTTQGHCDPPASDKSLASSLGSVGAGQSVEIRLLIRIIRTICGGFILRWAYWDVRRILPCWTGAILEIPL